MENKEGLLRLFSPEWFSVILGTLAFSIVINRFAVSFSIKSLIDAGLVILGLGFIFLIAITVLVLGRAIRYRTVAMGDWNDLNKISFIVVLPLSILIFNVGLLDYFPQVGSAISQLSTYNYFVEYLAILFLSLLLGYKLYTKELAIGEITYALLIPPVALATTTLLGTSIIPYLSKSLAQLVYFQILLGLGIAIFLFIFLGSLALASHAKDIKTLESSPITIIPMGVASIIVINILFLSRINALFLVPEDVAITLSLLLWGFELWNFGVALVVGISRIPKMHPNMSLWAYTFPLAIFSISSLQLATVMLSVGYAYPGQLLHDISIAAAISLFVAWMYSSAFTVAFLLRVRRQLLLAGGVKQVLHSA